MGSAKSIRVLPISSRDARRVIRRIHYSGMVVTTWRVHYGVFLDGRCGGALQYGPPMDKKRILPLVEGSEWESVVELNRMAFADWLPRNSESRAIGYTLRDLRDRNPRLEWVISFADAARCGDGTIYRASGFLLTQIKKTTDFCRLPDGRVIHHLSVATVPNTPRPELGGRTYHDVCGGRYSFGAYVEASGAEVVGGHQLRYVYPLRPGVRERITCDVLPFSAIAEAGAGMYRGEPRKSAPEA